MKTISELMCEYLDKKEIPYERFLHSVTYDTHGYKICLCDYPVRIYGMLAFGYMQRKGTSHLGGFRYISMENAQEIYKRLYKELGYD